MPGGGERLLRMVNRKPGRNLGPMRLNPVGILRGGLLRFVRQASSLEETPSDDLGSLRFGRHDHRFAKPIEELLESLKVGLVLGRHLVDHRGQRHREHYPVLGSQPSGAPPISGPPIEVITRFDIDGRLDLRAPPPPGDPSPEGTRHPGP
jgi:hypothetical protein